MYDRLLTDVEIKFLYDKYNACPAGEGMDASDSLCKTCSIDKCASCTVSGSTIECTSCIDGLSFNPTSKKCECVSGIN